MTDDQASASTEQRCTNCRRSTKSKQPGKCISIHLKYNIVSLTSRLSNGIAVDLKFWRLGNAFHTCTSKQRLLIDCIIPIKFREYGRGVMSVEDFPYEGHGFIAILTK